MGQLGRMDTHCAHHGMGTSPRDPPDGQGSPPTHRAGGRADPTLQGLRDAPCTNPLPTWLQGLLVYLGHPVTQCQFQGFLGAVASILSTLAVPQGCHILHS